MQNLSELLNSLLENNFILNQIRFQNNNYQNYYRKNPQVTFDEIKNFYKGTSWEEYILKFSTSRELIYCVTHNVLETPPCPYCGKPRKFRGTEGYNQTCGGTRCHQAAVADTCMKVYGHRCSSQAESVKRKSEETCLKRWGVPHAAQNERIKEKTKQYFLDTYGVDSAAFIPGSQEKRNLTYLKNRDVNIEKRKSSFMAKYGVENPSQVKEFQDKKSKRYTFENQNFDSSHELYFYLYHKMKNHDILRCPKRIEYYDGENNKHYYYPDFEVDGQLWEIKGEHMLDPEGHLIPNKLDPLREQEKVPFKEICMKNNGVHLIPSESPEMKNIIKEVKKIYGPNFVKNCRNLT